MENAEQLTMFNEAEDTAEEKIIEKADKITVVTHERKSTALTRIPLKTLKPRKSFTKQRTRYAPNVEVKQR